MAQSLHRAIISTLLYADIFDYPLTREEIGKWLIKSRIKNHKSRIKNEIHKLRIIQEKDGFYFIKGREMIIQIRKEKEKHSKEKYKIGNKVTSIIKFIPSVKLIGITGNLAINNADKNDDIDLLIITESGLLWITRLLVTIFIELLGGRRRPNDKNVRNKICLNMFVSEDCLSVPINERDLFSAHEVAQMKPLFDRDDAYDKFLASNKWIEDYLPNAISIKYQVLIIRNNKKEDGYMVKLLNYIESILKKLQLKYMKKRMTREIIREGVIRFHPKDSREWVLREYNSRVEKYAVRVFDKIQRAC